MTLAPIFTKNSLNGDNTNLIEEINLTIEQPDLNESNVIKLEDIKTLITAKSTDISFSKPKKYSSDAWLSFDIVNYKNKPQKFVKCLKCDNIISYEESHGTNQLNRHLTKHHSDKQNKSLHDFGFANQPIPKSKIDDFNKAIADYLVLDLVPFKAVEGIGFRNIIEKALILGRDYKQQKADDIIYHRTFLKKMVCDEADQKRAELSQNLKKAITYPNLSFSFDVGSDKYRHQPYLSISVHYVDHTGTLQSQLLDLVPITSQTKTSIKRHIMGTITAFCGMDNVHVFNNSIQVTDAGSNVTDIFPKQSACMNHKLNNALSSVLTDSDRSSPTTKKAAAIITEVKSLVEYVKRSKINLLLNPGLKQSVVTRFNSTYTCLYSLVTAYPQLQPILNHKKMGHKLSQINFADVEILCKVLQPFHDITLLLGADKEATLFKVALFNNAMINFLSPTETDDDSEEDFESDLKKEILIQFKKYFTSSISSLHNAALFVHPK